MTRISIAQTIFQQSKIRNLYIKIRYFILPFAIVVRTVSSKQVFSAIKYTCTNKAFVRYLLAVQKLHKYYRQQTKIRILEATVMTVVKYSSEAWTLRKADENLLDVFQRNCLRIVLGTRLTDRISNSRLYEKCGSIPLSGAIMKERLRWLGHVLRVKDDRLPKIVLFGQPSGATRKAGRPCLGWEDVINKDLKEMGTSWEGVKREALNRLGWRRSLRSCVGLRRLGAAVSY